jgi:hypothetical protein
VALGSARESGSRCRGIACVQAFTAAASQRNAHPLLLRYEKVVTFDLWQVSFRVSFGNCFEFRSVDRLKFENCAKTVGGSGEHGPSEAWGSTPWRVTRP